MARGGKSDDARKPVDVSKVRADDELIENIRADKKIVNADRLTRTLVAFRAAVNKNT